jgi:flagellar biosynthesis component FlhA
MRWIVGIVVFALALMANAPFFGALILGTAAWFITRLFTPQERAPEPVPDTPAQNDQLDVTADESLRAYLRRLENRVDAL